ncbi:MAG: patatin-like phospholipase family protein [Acidiferrobacterales bacterium]
MAIQRLVTLLLVPLVAACTAHFPVNEPLERHDPETGYRLKELEKADDSKELFLMLTFSGGGTRGAALAYGVLEELAKTEVVVEGQRRQLLDEVDVISSVSGGSFTAAYYGLFRDRIFEDFEERFLKKNIQKALEGEFLRPDNWARLGSAGFSRSDLVAKYYDKHIFEGATYADLEVRGEPQIVINATDIVLGTVFEFTQSYFDWICSDLSKLPVARAVAASSAIPVFLTPIILHNYAGRCTFQPPEWFSEALHSGAVAPHRFEEAKQRRTYLNVTERPYIQLMDGGLADNLGLRAPLDGALLLGGLWSALREFRLEGTRRIVVIAVNAEHEADTSWMRRERAPKIEQVLGSLTAVSIRQANSATLEIARRNFPRWREEVRTKRCAAQGRTPSVNRAAEAMAGACDDFETRLVEVNLDALLNVKERTYLKQLPTSFHLQPEDVDRLRSAAAKLLAQSASFQSFIKQLR